MQLDNSNLIEKLSLVERAGFPIYILEGLTPSILPQKGTLPNKVIIHSVPKAGTYLLAKLLQVAGYLDGELHLGLESFSDYRGKFVEQKRERYLDFDVKMNACHIAKFVLEGQFVVGHLPCNEEIRRGFASFKQLFIYREIRDSLISHMRFLATRNNPSHEVWRSISDDRERLVEYLQTSADEFLNLVRPMVGWLSTPDVLPISFERLCGDEGVGSQNLEIIKILDYLGISTHVAIDDELKRNVFGVETLTWSGKRTVRSDYWSEKAELLFEEIGGDNLNRLLSYSESATTGSAPDPQAEISARLSQHSIEINQSNQDSSIDSLSRAGISPQAVETLTLLINAEDVMKDLHKHEADLDNDLLDLVKLNAQTAHSDGNVDIASAMDNLAAYIETNIERRSNSNSHEKNKTQAKPLQSYSSNTNGKRNPLGITFSSQPTLYSSDLESIEQKGLFVVGSVRSGTSVFCDCLNLSHDIYLLQEAHLFEHSDHVDFVAHFNAQHEEFGNNRFKGTYIPPTTLPERDGLSFLARMGSHYKYVGEKVAFGPRNEFDGGIHPQDVFFDFHVRYFYHSTYFAIVRNPVETIWSMHKMWPKQQMEVQVACWARTIHTLIDVVGVFPNAYMVFLEHFSPKTITYISSLLNTAINLPEDMLGTQHPQSKNEDGELPIDLHPYKHLLEICTEIYASLEQAICPSSLQYKLLGHRRKFFKDLQHRVADLSNLITSGKI